MRKTTELRKVSSSDTGMREGRDVKSVSHEVTPLRNFERSMLSTISDMERMMEDVFHRSHFGFNLLPFRNLFGEGGFGNVVPAVDIFEEKGFIVVKSELPGMKRDEISVKLVDTMLTISGEKRVEEKIDRKDFIRLERSSGTFSRTVALPEGLDSEHVTASFRDGVLEVRIPKTEEHANVHTITVN